MNWERVKNFLIVLFIAINIFLVAFMFNSFRADTSITKDVIDDTVHLLQTNGIEIDSNIIPLSVNTPGSFDVMPIAVNNSYQSPKQLGESNIESEIKKALKALGVKDFEITSKGSGKYQVLQKIQGYFIFGGGIDAQVSGNNITLSGVWYKKQTKPTKESDALPMTAVLIDFMNNPDRNPQTHKKIESIDIGYCVPAYGGGTNHKSMPAVAGYYLTVSDGTSFLYEAASGTYITSK